MRTLSAWALVFVVALGSTPTEVLTQEPARTDSLEAQVRRLRMQLDSLQHVLEELIRQGQDTTSALTELARIRAAAQTAAGKAELPDTTTLGSQTRDLSILNPEISVNADVVGSYVVPDGASSSFNAIPREFEFSFQAAVDSYTRTKIFVTHEEELEIAGFVERAGEDGRTSVEIEEGYLYWVGLPAAIGLKVGKFRQEIGLYNRWHTHALLEVDRPLASRAFLGDDGLIQTGASASLPSFTVGPATQTIIAEVALGNNEALFDGGSHLSFLGRFQSFWEVGSAAFLQFGATGLTGRNDDVNLKTRLAVIDFMFRWTPPRQARYRDFQIKGAWYFSEREEAGTKLRGNGGYGQFSFKFAQQWIVGTRVDYLTPYLDNDPNYLQMVPSLTWWQSENVRLRAQYHYVKPKGMAASHTVLLQIVWAIGPHRHENY
ncbi:MAG: hypothetical protein V3T56_03750 [Gemmatimonadales bacterium]